METQPLVSVIIPNYNHSGYLSERINSVMEQNFKNFEVILMDDLSTDGSKDILLSYQGKPKISHIVINTENSGSTFKQWQKGLQLAKGKYIWIAESDDSASPIFLDKLVSILESNEAISVAFCKSNIIDENNKVLSLENTQATIDSSLGKENYIIDGRELLDRAFRHLNIIPNASAVVFRKDAIDPVVFERIKKMRYAGDWLFWVSLIQDFKVAFVSEYLNNFRFHSQSTRGGKSVEDDTKRMEECLSIIDEISAKNKFNRATVKMSWLHKDWILRVINRDKDYKELIRTPFDKNLRYYIIVIELILKHNIRKLIKK